MSVDLSAGEEPEKNMWSTLLQEARETSKGGMLKSQTSAAFFVGDKKCGKSSLLMKWKDCISSQRDIPDYILDYSYVNVKDKFNLESEEVISRMSVFMLDDELHSEILYNLTCDPCNSVFLIGLDLAAPHNLIRSLEKWFKVYEDTCEKLLAKCSEEQRNKLKAKLSEYVQNFGDTTPSNTTTTTTTITTTTTTTATTTATTTTTTTTSTADTTADTTATADTTTTDTTNTTTKEIDPSIPANNYGIPLFIVGLKGDAFERRTGEDEKFGFVVRRLRQEALKYGATLIFTSSVGAGINTEPLKDHIFHRLFGLQLNHNPKTTGTCTQWPIHIPAGYDKASDINSSTISDAMSMIDVFEYVEEKKEERKEKEVKAQSDQAFFNSLRGHLTSGHRTRSRVQHNFGNRKKKDVVKDFFNTLRKENSR